MSNLDDLIKRIDVFDDSPEVASSLERSAIAQEAEGDIYAYIEREGAAHILGLWGLLNEIKTELANNKEVGV